MASYAQYQEVLALENLDKLKRDFEALRRCPSKGVRDEIVQELIAIELDRRGELV